MSIDYSLYLVTDRAILKGRDIFKAVEDAIKGGVTLLQLREKDISTKDFYNLALKIKIISKYYNIPLIINDRLDIALAIDADGLHIGQDDMPIKIARKLLGKNKLLGYSVANAAEAIYGEKNGADYLGAGPVYPTGSKVDAGTPIGPEGLKIIRDSVSIPIVGIGGISLSNISEVKSSGIDGISLISAILGNTDIENSSKILLNKWKDI
jgi:thiamine-phosphate pyrophosphorylase